MSQTVVIVAGGAPELWPDLGRFKEEATIWVGVDRGALFLLEENLQPTLAIGDFDSLSKPELKRVEAAVEEIIYAQAEKDDTDTQLAVATVLTRYPEAEVRLIGVTGGRIDNFLANLWLPMEPRFQPKIRQIQLLDQQNTIQYFGPGDYQLIKEATKKYLAFVCLTPVADLSLYDAKYQLAKQKVLRPTSYASNEFIGSTSRFSFSAGLIAVIQSAD